MLAPAIASVRVAVVGLALAIAPHPVSGVAITRVEARRRTREERAGWRCAEEARWEARWEALIHVFNLRNGAWGVPPPPVKP